MSAPTDPILVTELRARGIDADDCEPRDGGLLAVLPGWWADHRSEHAVEYTYADSGREAAEEYVADGDWGDDDDTTTWVVIDVWRVGLRRVECSYCRALATAHDEVGDPACDEHAEVPEAGVALAPLVVEERADEATHRVALEPDEPSCTDGHEHDWCAPHSVVGGCAETPGVWGHGAGTFARDVCRHCGWYRLTDTWAQDRTDGTQGLTSTRYEEPDRGSLAWVESLADAEGGAQ